MTRRFLTDVKNVPVADDSLIRKLGVNAYVAIHVSAETGNISPP